jgi:type II secretory pathway component PulJ
MTKDLSTSAFKLTENVLESERKRILTRLHALWWRGGERLKEAVIELDIYLDLFNSPVINDTGHDFNCLEIRFEELKSWLEGNKYSGWIFPDDSAIAGLSEAELYLVLVKSEVDRVHYLLSGNALEQRLFSRNEPVWSISDATGHGIATLISCERALFHAEQLLVANLDKMTTAV